LTVRQGGSKGAGVDLKPEKSRNMTLGVVFEPTRDISISVDLFQIYQKDLIGILNADNVLQDYIDNFNVATGTSTSKYAGLVFTKFNPAVGAHGSTVIDYVKISYDNFGEQLTRGADISLKFRLPKMEIGNMRLNVDATYLDSQKSRDKGETAWSGNGVDQFLTFGAVLRWKQRTELIWDKGPWEGSLSYNWQSSYQDQHASNAFTGAPLPNRVVGSYETWDAQLKYTGIKNLTLSGSVSNLFDTIPPFSQQGVYFQMGYDPANTNPRGRAVAFNAKYQF
jgi:iron complex outermembrane receptor protein